MLSAAGTRWIAGRRIRPNCEVRLFCLPYAGGGTLAFRTWPERLPDWIEVCPVQLPGREARAREAAFTSVYPLAAALATELQPLLLERPFALFGHSMGALIAFELAREIRRRSGVEPCYLFASGRHAPDCPLPHPPLHQLSDAELLVALQRIGGTPNEVLGNPDLIRFLLPLLRADLRVHEAYEYTGEPPLACPVLVLGGADDRHAEIRTLEGWKRHTTGPCSVRILPGNHFFVHTAERSLLALTVQELARATMNSRAPLTAMPL